MLKQEVQVGQALVIALSIALNDILYIDIDISLFTPSGYMSTGERNPILIGVGLARGSVELADRHVFSLYFMLPLIGVCFGLLKHNWCALSFSFSHCARAHSMILTGTLHERLWGIRSATFQEWRSPSSAF